MHLLKSKTTGQFFVSSFTGQTKWTDFPKLAHPYQNTGDAAFAAQCLGIREAVEIVAR